MFPEQRRPIQALCLGVYFYISKVWIPGKQCTHLAPKKNYIKMSMHLASDLSCICYHTKAFSANDLSLQNHEVKVSNVLFLLLFFFIFNMRDHPSYQLEIITLLSLFTWENGGSERLNGQIGNQDQMSALILEYNRKLSAKTLSLGLCKWIIFWRKNNSAGFILSNIKIKN